MNGVQNFNLQFLDWEKALLSISQALSDPEKALMQEGELNALSRKINQFVALHLAESDAPQIPIAQYSLTKLFQKVKSLSLKGKKSEWQNKILSILTESLKCSQQIETFSKALETESHPKELHKALRALCCTKEEAPQSKLRCFLEGSEDEIYLDPKKIEENYNTLNLNLVDPSKNFIFEYASYTLLGGNSCDLVILESEAGFRPVTISEKKKEYQGGDLKLLTNFFLIHQLKLQLKEAMQIEKKRFEFLDNYFNFELTPDTPLDREALEVFTKIPLASTLPHWIEVMEEKIEKCSALLSKFSLPVEIFVNSFSSYTPIVFYLRFLKMQEKIKMALQKNETLTPSNFTKESPLWEKFLVASLERNYSRAVANTALVVGALLLALTPKDPPITSPSLSNPSFSIARELLKQVMGSTIGNKISVEVDFKDLSSEDMSLIFQAILARIQLEKEKVTRIILHNCPLLDATAIEQLLHYELEYLELQFCDNIDNDALCMIPSKSPKLKFLHLANLPKLSQFGYPKQVRGLVPLTFQSLEFLHISNCSQLKQLRLRALSLERMDLYKNPNLYGDLIAQVSTVLKPSSVENIFRKIIKNKDLQRFTESMKPFPEFTKVEFKAFDLTGCKEVTDRAISLHLAKLPLHTLILQSCLTFTGLEFPFHGLVKLNCSNTALSEQGIVTICENNKTLQEFDLSENHFPDQFLAPLKTLSLKSLNLSSCSEITDKALSYLQVMTSLQTLRLNNLKNLKGSGLTYLLTLPLEILSLARCNRIQDDGVGSLTVIKTLKIVNLTGCQKISQKTIKFLEEERKLFFSF